MAQFLATIFILAIQYNNRERATFEASKEYLMTFSLIVLYFFLGIIQSYINVDK